MRAYFDICSFLSLSGLTTAKFARDGAYAAITDPLDGRVAARAEGYSPCRKQRKQKRMFRHSLLCRFPQPFLQRPPASPQLAIYANRYARLFKSIHLMYSEAGRNLSDTFSNKWIYFVT